MNKPKFNIEAAHRDRAIPRKEYWVLELHLYEKAAKAGVTPVKVQPFELKEWGPQHYTPREFVFVNPPSREDLLTALWQFPWSQHIETTLAKLLPGNEFPIMEHGFKASSTVLFDGVLKVGELRLRREFVFDNAPYAWPPTLYYEEQEAAGRSQKAKEILDRYTNFFREQVVRAGVQDSSEETVTLFRRLLKDVFGITSKAKAAKAASR